MVVVQEVFKRQLQPAVLRERCHTGHQPSRIAIGGANVIQYVFCRFLFQLDIAALGDGHKAVLDLPAPPRGGHPVGQQEIHEHEAPGGGFGRRLHCRLTSFSRSLQTILRIILDGTKPKLNINISTKIEIKIQYVDSNTTAPHSSLRFIAMLLSKSIIWGIGAD